MTRPTSCLWWLVCLLPPVLVACEATSHQTSDVPIWTTEAEFEIGDAVEGEALFSRVSDVRLAPGGDRVFVLESGPARLTTWTLDGSLVLNIGRSGEGPGEFQGPSKVELRPEGFLVRDSRRFTLFDHDGGMVRTFQGPPTNLSFRGFRLGPRALLRADEYADEYLALPMIPARVVSGWMGDDPVQDWPVFRVWQAPAGWTMETVVVLDKANSVLSVRPSDGSFEWGYHGPQPYGDSDQELYDSGTGTVVVVRRRAGKGQVRLVEVTALGDTVWDRSLQLPAIPVRSKEAIDYMEDIAEQLAARSETSASPVTKRQARTLVEEAFYLPEFYPAVDYVHGTSNREVWMRTHEQVDTLQVWYTVRRGDNESSPRRVLLPETFYASDVTDTHVWGIRYDTLGVNYVAGRRLVGADQGG